MGLRNFLCLSRDGDVDDDDDDDADDDDDGDVDDDDDADVTDYVDSPTKNAATYIQQKRKVQQLRSHGHRVRLEWQEESINSNGCLVTYKFFGRSEYSIILVPVGASLKLHLVV